MLPERGSSLGGNESVDCSLFPCHTEAQISPRAGVSPLSSSSFVSGAPAPHYINMLDFSTLTVQRDSWWESYLPYLSRVYKRVGMDCSAVILVYSIPGAATFFFDFATQCFVLFLKKKIGGSDLEPL